MTFSRLMLASVVMVCTVAAHAHAEDYVLTIKDHVFSPAELTIPADKEVVLTVKNQDASPEEFESHDLKREKVIKGNSEGIVKLGPLKPGTYKYVGEFHEKTAKGTIVAK